MTKSEITHSQKKKNLLLLITPFLIAMGICLFEIIKAFLDIQKSEGWSFFEIIIYVPAAFLLLGLKVFIKSIFGDKALFIWITEIILLIIGIWVLYYNQIL